MNPTDLGDATARALDLLPPGDSASSDPRLVRDPQLAEEARQSRETAAAVWLAVSPLRVAPPDVLLEVMREIHSPESALPATRHRSFPWLAASGWAAAAVVAISLWPERLPQAASREFPSGPAKFSAEAAADVTPAATRTSRDARLRKDIARLQDRLADLQSDALRRTPRVMSLSAPGAARRSEEESRQYVQRLLTEALRSALEAASGAPSDPASLVIERGWLPGGLPVPDDGGLIRHRNFPEQDWQELGLSRSANGNYYDAASQVEWSPDPEGRGFIGKKIEEKDNVAKFNQQPGEEPASQKPEATPEGFVIGNPVENTTEIFVENLPEIPPGKQLILQTTDASGEVTTTPLTPSGTEESPASDALAMNMSDFQPTWAGRGVLLSSNGTIAGIPGSLANTTTSGLMDNTFFNSASNAALSINIVGYLYGGSLIVNFPRDSIPAEVQLAIGDIAPTGTPPQIILKSER